MKVDSPVGEVSLDATGSPVAVVRMDASQAYADIPGLLKEHINNRDTQAWEQIETRIDYMFTNLDHALGALEKETGLGDRVKSHLRGGKKLLFKPNLVSPVGIDPVTHGEGAGNAACTQWPFVAALMRWFHDKLDISYHEMAIGEAATTMSSTAMSYSMHYNEGKTVTTESVIEGKCGDFYGGWGFYFIRNYLSETHPASHEDNPMNGYEESISGEYLPPGRTGNRLIVYDLNRLQDMKSKGREVPVPDGANFQEITLHKVIVGGDPADPEDIKDYPGCVLVNVPRLKVHVNEPLTNAIKNIGIGLYPMEVTSDNDPNSTRWKYAVPQKYPPCQKALLPHEVWVPEIDEETGLPVRDEKGEYVVNRTAGLKGTMADVIRATTNQNVLIIHVADAIEAVNLSWSSAGMVPEGFAFTSLDPVALDFLCYRYALKNVPMQEARRLQRDKNLPTDFIQKVPVPGVDGLNIVTGEGYDAPVFRSNLLGYAEGRGLGQRSYYVVGWDAVAGAPLASLEGHLGRMDGQKFTELITTQFYRMASLMLWGLQATTLNYFKANDSLTGSSYLKELLDAFDENGDGVIDIDETGRKGYYQVTNRWLGDGTYLRATEKYGTLHGAFLSGSRGLRYSNEKWNPQGYDFCKEYRLASLAAMALRMSQAQTEEKDPLFSSMTWGKGKWPSAQYVRSVSISNTIYGAGAPGAVGAMSMYGYAFQYADKTLNGGGYTGSTGITSDPQAVSNYIEAVSKGDDLLDFVLYVPKGYGVSNGASVPNVEETEDPDKVFRASFNKGKEVW